MDRQDGAMQRVDAVGLTASRLPLQLQAPWSPFSQIHSDAAVRQSGNLIAW